MKTFLLLLVAVGSLAAQQLGSYYAWSTSYGPVNSTVSPTGYTNEYNLPGQYSTQVSSQAYCVHYPFSNAYIQFAFQMTTGCPEGVYISEDGSNGFFADPNCNPPNNPSCSMWNTMVQNGVVIDGAITYVQLEIWQWEYSCGAYYFGPTYDYDDQLNPCQT